MFSVTIREKSGQVYTFHFDKPEIMIGRVKGNDVILPKQNISKRHALVRVQGQRFIVEDLGSTNGTYVNGHRIATPVEIGSEDKVYLGDFVMQYYDLGQSSADRLPPVDVDDELDAAGADFAETQARFVGPEPVAALPAADPATSAADIDFGGAVDFDGAAGFDGFGADHNLGAGYGLGTYDAEAAGEPFEAVDEATVAELEHAATDAMAEIKARRAAAAAGEADAVIVSTDPGSIDPDAIDPDDDRMTGRIDGLSAALDAAVVPDLDMGMDLHLELDLPAPTAGLEATDATLAHMGMATAEGDALAVPTGHYEALGLLYTQAIDTLGAAIGGDAAQLSDAEWASMEEQVVAFVDDRATADALGPDPDVDRLKRDLIYEISGLGPLETLLDDATVETIEVNAYDAVWLVRHGERSPCAQRFSSQAALTAAAERLVRASGVAPDDSATWADGTLADGTTIRVAWPPMCPTGPVLLIRKPRADSPTLDDLVARDVVTAVAAEQLRSLLLAGRSIGLVGPAGAGRRTVLNALALHIPPAERIVVVEQGVRLCLKQPQVVRLDASPGIDRVLGIAHRLRPDRVLLGACGAGELMALVDRTSDGFSPWMGLLVGDGANAAVERAVNAHAVRHVGVDRATASARVATALDVLGVFSAAEGGPVLDTVVEVVREGDTLRTHPIEG